MVLDTKQGACPYETSVPGNLPKFIYCPGTSVCNFTSGKHICKCVSVHMYNVSLYSIVEFCIFCCNFYVLFGRSDGG